MWSEADLRFWRTLFEDPALNRLIDSARQENLALRIAGLRILESRAVLGIAGSNLYPQVQQVGGGISYLNSKRKGGPLPNGTDSTIAYQMGFNLAWELDLGVVSGATSSPPTRHFSLPLPASRMCRY